MAVWEGGRGLWCMCIDTRIVGSTVVNSASDGILSVMCSVHCFSLSIALWT